MPPEEHQNATPAKRAIRKIRTACLVNSLARGWQQWATEHCTKQAKEPSGWVPGEEKPLCIPSKQWISQAQFTFTRKERLAPTESTFVKIDLTKEDVKSPSENEAPEEDERQSPGRSEEALQKLHIRSKEVTKMVVSKIYERSSGVNFLSNRYEKDECPENGTDTEDLRNLDKLFSGRISPTRSRKCSNLVSELTKGWKQIEEEEKTSETEPHNCRSDSLDTEDSGYGGDHEEMLDPEHSSQEAVSAIRIKRPTSTLASRTSKASKKYRPVYNLKDRWEQWADEHILIQKLNPFSDEFDYELAMTTRLRKGDEGYGYPKEGTKTAERAKRAEAHIYREMKDMCFIIRTMAPVGRDGRIRVTFGELFDRYVHISDKVVGILMRARKHGMVDFEGEMLWQGRDDHVIITLLE